MIKIQNSREHIPYGSGAEHRNQVKETIFNDYDRNCKQLNLIGYGTERRNRVLRLFLRRSALDKPPRLKQKS